MKKLVPLLLVVGSTGVAFAQPAPDQPPPPQPAPAPPPPEATQPPPTTVPVMPDNGPMMHHDDDNDHRPSELAFGIGFGYVFPTSLETPNITSVRIRLPTGLTIEPRLILGTSSTNQDNGTVDVTSRSTEFGIGAIARFPLIKRGRADFELLGAIDLDTLKQDPDTDNDDDATTTTTVSLSWGVAVNYWISHHWSFSLSATNPLVSYTKQSVQTPAATNDTSNTSFALEFNPTVFAMVHLYN